VFSSIAAVAAGAFAVFGQRAPRQRRIAVFMNLAAGDPEAASRLAAFLREMTRLGWKEGDNLRIDYRWGASVIDRQAAYATELISFEPDVIMAAGGPIVRILQKATSTVPIVFVQAIDPIGAGIVSSLHRPGGNTTGFASIDYGMGEKRLELLKELAPNLNRLAVIRDSATSAGAGQFSAIEAVGSRFGVEVTAIDTHDIREMERALAAFASTSNGGLLITTSTFATMNRESLVLAAARYRLPAIYPGPLFVESGGLLSYGSSVAHQYQLAAGYVDRILKGANPGDLPVQQPTRYELAINLKTANSLGIEVSRTLLVAADHIFE
jgi:putative tryptophan/tyrosine transport system substrate-binding protein